MKPCLYPCAGQLFSRTKIVDLPGQFGLYLLTATDGDNRDDCIACLDQLKAAHKGDGYFEIAHPYYISKCHYSICPELLRKLRPTFHLSRRTAKGRRPITSN
jgi:hypothetical protein